MLNFNIILIIIFSVKFSEHKAHLAIISGCQGWSMDDFLGVLKEIIFQKSGNIIDGLEIWEKKSPLN